MTASLLHGLAAALVVTASLLAPLAFADDEKKAAGDGYDARLPVNPFANAKEGDWYVMVARMKGAEGTKLPPGMLAPKFVEWRVVKVDGDKVTVKESEPEKATPKEHVFSKAEAPTIAQYMDMKKRGKMDDLESEDAECKLGDANVPCKKVTFVEKDGAMTATGRIFISEKVKGGGMLRLEAEISGPRGTLTMVGECVGTGCGDKTEWGKTLAEAQKAEKAAGEKAEEPEKAEKPEKSGKK